jgi:hypothetical protein
MTTCYICAGDDCVFRCAICAKSVCSDCVILAHANVVFWYTHPPASREMTINECVLDSRYANFYSCWRCIHKKEFIEVCKKTELGKKIKKATTNL